jgi:DNA repair exonuclease SbcCD nuclease subunit
MRILHTADWHISRPFVGLGPKGAALRDAQMQTVKRIVALASEREVDALIIAGDAFDSSEVSGSLVRRVVSPLAGLGVPVFFLPGTHDWLTENSIYRSCEFREDNIHVFGIDAESFEVGEAAIHGYANRSKGGERPLRELVPDPGAEVNVAVVHGSIRIPSKSNPADNLITSEDISRSCQDYVCMGHWHKRQDFSSGRTTAFYSGCPEQLKFGEGAGAGDVLIVEIDGGKVKVEPVRVGRFKWIDKIIDLCKFPPGSPLDSQIQAETGNDVLLRVRLIGALPRGKGIDAREIEEALGEEFFHLEVDSAGVGFQLDDLTGLFPKGTVGALYLEQLQREIKKARKPEEKALLEEALHRGAAYLCGEMEVS